MTPANAQPNTKTADRPLDTTRPFMDDKTHAISVLQTALAARRGGRSRPHRWMARRPARQSSAVQCDGDATTGVRYARRCARSRAATGARWSLVAALRTGVAKQQGTRRSRGPQPARDCLFGGRKVKHGTLRADAFAERAEAQLSAYLLGFPRPQVLSDAVENRSAWESRSSSPTCRCCC